MHRPSTNLRSRSPYRTTAGLIALVIAGTTGATALAATANAAPDPTPAVHHAGATASISGQVKGAPAGTGVSLTASNGQSGTGGPVHANGSYTLTDIGPGTYYMSVDLPKGYHATSATPGKGANGGTKVDGVARHDEIIGIKVTKGAKGKGYDFTVQR